MNCSDCKVQRIIADGFYTCPKCGVIADRVFVNEGKWIHNIGLKYKKKSVHSRNRWIYKKLKRIIDDQ